MAIGSSLNPFGISLNLQQGWSVPTSSSELRQEYNVVCEPFPIIVHKYKLFVPESFYVMLCCLETIWVFVLMCIYCLHGICLLWAHHRGRIQFHLKSIPVGFCGGAFWVEELLQIKLILPSGACNCVSVTSCHSCKAFLFVVVGQADVL